MTIDEAIEHAEWMVENVFITDGICGECGTDHRQLAEWLRELRDKRAEERSCAAIAAEAARQNRDLYAERAKLRELVRELKRHVCRLHRDEPCAVICDGYDDGLHCCGYELQMRELGIEAR